MCDRPASETPRRIINRGEGRIRAFAEDFEASTDLAPCVDLPALKTFRET